MSVLANMPTSRSELQNLIDQGLSKRRMATKLNINESKLWYLFYKYKIPYYVNGDVKLLISKGITEYKIKVYNKANRDPFKGIISDAMNPNRRR